MSTPTEPAPTAEQRITAVLDEHRPQAGGCCCRWRYVDPYVNLPRRRAEHAKHVAPLILAAVEPMIAAEALREAAGEVREKDGIADEPEHPYADLADWLDARAQRIEAG